MNNEQIVQHILHESLRLLEQGRSEASIIEAYPAYEHDITLLFNTIQFVRENDTVQPSEALFNSVLQTLTPLPVQSPYSNKNNFRTLFNFSRFQKISMAAAVFLIAVGGIVYTQYQPPTATTGSTATIFQISETTAREDTSISPDTSDAALEQNMRAVDDQLNGLDADNATIDQAGNS